MMVIWIIVFTILTLAGLLLIGQGASYLLAAQDNVVQQNAAASLATAYFLAGWICWWLAAGVNRRYTKLEEADREEWERQHSSTPEEIGTRLERGKMIWEQRKE